MCCIKKFEREAAKNEPLPGLGLSWTHAKRDLRPKTFIGTFEVAMTTQLNTESNEAQVPEEPWSSSWSI